MDTASDRTAETFWNAARDSTNKLFRRKLNLLMVLFLVRNKRFWPYAGESSLEDRIKKEDRKENKVAQGVDSI